ncbi:MAG TPA: ABC transporter permease [Clostridiales bacterium]|nr:ABC transporter permease [Clostridiales bacterium]
MMSRNNFGYFFREGLGSIFSHGFMSFASVCVIVACLIIMGSFTLLVLNVNNMIEEWESENQVVAFVDEALTDEEARALEARIESIDNVSNAVFVSRDDAFAKYLSGFDEEENDLFSDLEPTVLRHRYMVYLDDIEFMADTQTRLVEIDGIAKVNAHLEISEGFVAISRVVGVVSLTIILILLVVSMFIMANTIKLTTFDRREEIAIMKLVGATNGFIRWPFVFEGLLLGLFGSLVAFLIQWGIYEFVVVQIDKSATMQLIEAMSFATIALPLLGIFVATGFIVGIGGSLTVIRKYLKV